MMVFTNPNEILQATKRIWRKGLYILFSVSEVKSRQSIIAYLYFDFCNTIDPLMTKLS